MSESLTLIDMLIRGVAIGATVVIALAVWRSAVSRHVQIATLMLCVSVAAWLVSERSALWCALGHPLPLMLLAHPVGGLFWLFVMCVFDDRPLELPYLAPAALMFVGGIGMETLPPVVADPIWVARNLASGLLAVHAAVVIARGWRGDLVEGRRSLRAVLVGLVSLFAMMTVAVAFAHRLDPGGPWLVLAVGEPLGGAIIAVLILGIAALFLQARPALFATSRRVEREHDGRAEAADRQLIGRLQAIMAAEGWRREGLTIGDLAQELGVPEHRLRRLINQRLGYRNFADFVHGHRIEAAKRRLADPDEARTTVAAIAYDLGYGSLGPFNRAFRASTGATPTEYRRAALAGGAPISDEAG